MIVLSWLHYSGAEKQALYFAEAMIRNYGDRATVIGLEAPGSVIDVCKKLDIPVIYFPFSHRVSWREKILRMWQFIVKLRSLRPDFIAPYCMPADVLCGVTWRFTGARCCVWQQRDEGRHRRAGIMEKIALICTPRYISNSTHGAEWLITDLEVDRERIEVIYNGLKPIESGNLLSWKKTNGIKKEVRIVTMIASLHSKKDHMTLLEAWKIVCSAERDDTLLLVLAGKEMDTYEEIKGYIEAEKLNTKVMIAGYLDDVEPLLKDTELALFSSVAEGVPNGVLEPMQHSLPVICTDYPGMREALGSGEEDQIVPPGDPIALADRIRSFLADKEKMIAIGKRNRRRTETHFSMEQMVSKTRTLFLEN